MTDVTAGEAGNDERLAYLFDRRRVQAAGLAGEIVLPPGPHGDPVQQFARTPYAVGFRADAEPFVLVTAHIKYGGQPTEREEEISALAGYTAHEMRDRARRAQDEEGNLIILGDFNIDQRGGDPLFQAFVSTGLWLPKQLENLRTAFGREPKFYDQIAWFRDAFDLPYTEHAGVIDFSGAVFPELDLKQMAVRVSDHFPLWVEFSLDRSSEQMAVTLGVDPGAPDPLAVVPDSPPR
jgi:endonuclease/exonuclease/phosphatase family metal-dependent hydrolase